MSDYKIVNFTAKVCGVAWAGYKASTEYDFGWTKPTREQIIAKAGDFQKVTRVELFKTETICSRVQA